MNSSTEHGAWSLASPWPAASARRRLGWVAAVSVAVAVHAAAWWAVVGTGVPHRGGDTSGGPPSSTVSLRWVAAADAGRPAEPVMAALDAATIPDASDSAALPALAAAHLPLSDETTVPEPRVDPAAQPQALAPEGVDGYLPRKALTRPPRPRDAIAMPWPPGIQPLGRHSDVFTIFIDEEGRVRRMVPDSASLLPALEQSAREVFAAAAFIPGELDGRPVKSMMRIEVVFEAAPRAVAPPELAATSAAEPAQPFAPPVPVIVSRQQL